MFGGIGGLTNASYNLNLVIHNTAWVPGHFHLTVASAVTLSFMGITYWMVPHLTERQLLEPRLALVQAWTWFVGMIIFSNAMHVLGLLGRPDAPAGRRPLRARGVERSPAAGLDRRCHSARLGPDLTACHVKTALGRRSHRGLVPEVPIAESIRHPQLTPLWLDRSSRG